MPIPKLEELISLWADLDASWQELNRSQANNPAWDKINQSEAMHDVQSSLSTMDKFIIKLIYNQIAL